MIWIKYLWYHLLTGGYDPRGGIAGVSGGAFCLGRRLHEDIKKNIYAVRVEDLDEADDLITVDSLEDDLSSLAEEASFYQRQLMEGLGIPEQHIQRGRQSGMTSSMGYLQRLPGGSVGAVVLGNQRVTIEQDEFEHLSDGDLIVADGNQNVTPYDESEHENPNGRVVSVDQEEGSISVNLFSSVPHEPRRSSGDYDPLHEIEPPELARALDEMDYAEELPSGTRFDDETVDEALRRLLHEDDQDAEVLFIDDPVRFARIKQAIEGSPVIDVDKRSLATWGALGDYEEEMAGVNNRVSQSIGFPLSYQMAGFMGSVDRDEGDIPEVLSRVLPFFSPVYGGLTPEQVALSGSLPGSSHFIPAGWCGLLAAPYVLAKAVRSAGLEDDFPGLLTAKKQEARSVLLQSTAGFFFRKEGPVLVVRPPTEVHRQDDEFHNENGPALAFESGRKYYALNGIPVPEWLVELDARDIDPEWVVSVDNVDVRRELIQKVGIERLLDQLQHEVVDERKDYTLYEIDIGGVGLNGPGGETSRKYLRMRNPSTGTWHMEAVHPNCENVQQALNWRANGSRFEEWGPEEIS